MLCHRSGKCYDLGNRLDDWIDHVRHKSHKWHGDDIIEIDKQFYWKRETQVLLEGVSGVVAQLNTILELDPDAFFEDLSWEDDSDYCVIWKEPFTDFETVDFRKYLSNERKKTAAENKAKREKTAKNDAEQLKKLYKKVIGKDLEI